MTFIDHTQQAVLHRETYIALLKGILAWGSEKHFAQHVAGITPVYLSNLLNPDHDPPGERMAYQITKALPADAELRLDVLEHMVLARHHQTQADQALQMDWTQQPVEAFHGELRKAYNASTLANNTQSNNMPLVIVRDAGKALLKRINPNTHPEIFAEVCLIVHGAQGALNRHADALFLAKLAGVVLENADPSIDAYNRERIRYLRINAAYAESVTSRSLNLPRPANDLCDGILDTIKAEGKEQRQFWSPYLFKDKIDAVSRLSRFTLSEVEGLANQARAISEVRAMPSDARLLLIIDRALINAYIRYGSDNSLKKAGRLLQWQLDQNDPIAHAEPLLQAMFLSTTARFHWAQGNLDEWQYFIRAMLKIASEAGLEHQISQARGEYGRAMEPFQFP
jgi:hypothetical protein